MRLPWELLPVPPPALFSAYFFLCPASLNKYETLQSRLRVSIRRDSMMNGVTTAPTACASATASNLLSRCCTG